MSTRKVFACLCLLLVVGSDVLAQAPNCPTTACSPDPFCVDYCGRNYDVQEDESTYYYKLCWDGTAPGLSHFDLGAPICQSQFSVVNPPLDPFNGCGSPSDPAVDPSTDPDGPQGPLLGFFGFKWDNCSETPPSNGCEEFSLTVSGNRGENEVEWLTKAGNCNVGSCDSGNTTGPGCDVGNLPPVCDANGPYEVSCGNGTGQVLLDGTGSYDPDGGQTETFGDDEDDSPSCEITYLWTTDCPDGVFDDDTSPTPTLTFTTTHAEGVPLSCSAFLHVEDCNGGGDQCFGVVNVGECELDCLGVPEGEATFDDCGVCEGGNQGKDNCGVCFGGNSDQDSCGVCFGNNLSKDACGVCSGDGSTCLPVCEEQSLTPTQVALDGLGEDQRLIVKRAGRLLKRFGGSAEAAESASTEATALYTNNWKVIFSLDPTVQVNCTNAEFCVQVSNAATIDTYQNNAARLHTLADSLIKKLRRQLKAKGISLSRANKLKSKNDAKFAETGVVSAQVPVSTLSCG